MPCFFFGWKRKNTVPRQLEIDENAVRISQDVGYIEEDRSSKGSLEEILALEKPVSLQLLFSKPILFPVVSSNLSSKPLFAGEFWPFSAPIIACSEAIRA